MTRHRSDQPPTSAPEPTPPGGARDALDRLAQRAGLAADPDQVVEQATTAALAQTRTWLLRAIAIGAAFLVVGVTAVVVLGLYTIRVNNDLSELASTGAVGANRARASAEVRGYSAQSCDPALTESITLECANRERATYGLPAILAPDDAAPSQIAGLLGEARADLRRVREQRGESQPGVTTPPTSGRFRGPGR